MDREEAHKLVDVLFDLRRESVLTPAQETALNDAKDDIEQFSPEARARELPEGKRVVRTSTSGDRVYFLDEVKKTRQWVTNPDVLDSLGFEMGDVTDVEEDELLKYQMGPALYKRVDAE